MIEAFPLCWPPLRPRAKYRESARFHTGFAKARNKIVSEINLLGGTNAIISTNIELRRDGLPYATLKTPDDAGVAVYFTYKKNQMCFACDRWNKVEDNMHAISLTISALRGVARWGTGDMMQAAFTGFAALPPPMPAGKPWRAVFGLEGVEVGQHMVKEKYRVKRGEAHPDRHGGSDKAFLAVQAAYEQAARELGFDA